MTRVKTPSASEQSQPQWVINHHYRLQQLPQSGRGHIGQRTHTHSLSMSRYKIYPYAILQITQLYMFLIKKRIPSDTHSYPGCTSNIGQEHYHSHIIQIHDILLRTHTPILFRKPIPESRKNIPHDIPTHPGCSRTPIQEHILHTHDTLLWTHTPKPGHTPTPIYKS